MLRRSLRRYVADVSGATSVEYALLVALIGLAVIAGINGIGGQTLSIWTTTIVPEVASAMSGS